jgi:hypothetical protein
VKNRNDQEGESALLSRREWLGKLALPAAGVVVGAGLLGGKATAALPANAVKGMNDSRARNYNLRDYGAKGDGTTLDTAAFNTAIATCAAAGGGQVLVPPGLYLTGTIRLKSNITLLLEAGAEIRGTPDLKQYEWFTPPKGNPLAELASHWHRALLLGINIENVTIIGPGVINGNKVSDPHGEENMRGPHAVLFGNSRNITLRDISIKDAGNYAVMLEFTSEVEVRGIKITGGWDGVHFRGRKDSPSRNVTITDSEFFTGDDGIAGWFWENTLIARCIFNSSCNGIRVIGPAQRLIIHDCLFFGPGRFEHRTSRERHRTNMLAGILLQPGAWNPTKGLLDDVQISNITMHDVATPFCLTLTPGNTAGRIAVNRMTATGVYQAAASIESWAEGSVEKMTLRDVNFEFSGGGRAEQMELPIGQPEQDARVLPVWGLYIRKVRVLELQNVRLNLIEPDARSAFMAEDVERIELDAFRTPRNDVRPLALSNVQDVDLSETDVKIAAGTCIGLETRGAPIAITATIKNQFQSGLIKVQVSLDDRLRTRWVDMRANEQRDVVFTGWGNPAPGMHTVQCGDLQKKLHISE